MAADGRQEVDADGTGSGAFAEQRQGGGVAAEGGDVVLDPLDGQRLVVEALVTRRLLIVHVQKPLKKKSILIAFILIFFSIFSID